jgi:transcriptional regulator with XRE-family HTH domain
MNRSEMSGVADEPRSKQTVTAAEQWRTGRRDGLLKEVGTRLRRARQQQHIGLRELARRIGVSPSLISQVETGKSEPSVSTLFAICSELGLPVNEIVFDPLRTSRNVGPRQVEPGAIGEPGVERPAHAAKDQRSPVQDPENRRSIQLDSGVIWERLTAQPDHDVDFLYLRYPPGSESTAPEALMRHNGREYGFVISGRLHVTLGFDEYEVGPGGSISFDCTQPHRFANHGDRPVEAVWLVLGRSLS